MIIETRTYITDKGKMKLWLKNQKKLSLWKGLQVIENWYKLHPYAKRIEEDWICGDYRIDQQRPERNVYSEHYLRILSIGRMEVGALENTIKTLESKINYPIVVYDDGENTEVIQMKKNKMK